MNDSQPVIQVVRVSDEIAEPLSEFFRQVWNDGSTGESVRKALANAAAANPAAPGVQPPAAAYLLDGSVVGYLSTIPVKIWNGQVETPGHWLKGFMVLPEHRNGPIGFAVLKQLIGYLGSDVSGTLLVAAPARRLLSAVGYADYGVVPNFIAPLRSAVIARNLDVGSIGVSLSPVVGRVARFAQRVGAASAMGHVAALGLVAVRAARGRAQGRRVDIEGSLPAKAELDDLWRDVRSHLAASAVRDGAFLEWRYSPRRDALYEAVSSYETKRGRLTAVAVVRRPREASDPRLRGIKVATLSDIVVRTDDRDSTLAILGAAERVARRMGADALVCSTAHPALTAPLSHRAWLRLSGNVHLVMRDVGGALQLPTAVERWWITRGDASADEAF